MSTRLGTFGLFLHWESLKKGNWEVNLVIKSKQKIFKSCSLADSSTTNKPWSCFKVTAVHFALEQCSLRRLINLDFSHILVVAKLRTFQWLLRGVLKGRGPISLLDPTLVLDQCWKIPKSPNQSRVLWFGSASSETSSTLDTQTKRKLHFEMHLYKSIQLLKKREQLMKPLEK